MVSQQNTIAIMDPDPQILQGLVLLLEDMQFAVIAASNAVDLEAVISDTSQQPCLIMLPHDLDNTASVLKLVRKIRISCHNNIPAILYTQEDCISSWRLNQEDDSIICCELNSQHLRQHIKAALSLA